MQAHVCELGKVRETKLCHFREISVGPCIWLFVCEELKRTVMERGNLQTLSSLVVCMRLIGHKYYCNVSPIERMETTSGCVSVKHPSAP